MDLIVFKLCTVVLIVCVKNANFQSISSQIQGIRGTIAGTRQQMPGSMGPISGPRSQLQGMRGQLPGTRIQVPGTRSLTSGIRGQIPVARGPMSISMSQMRGTRGPMPVGRGQMSGIRGPVPPNRPQIFPSIPQTRRPRGQMQPAVGSRDVTIRSQVGGPTMSARMPRPTGPVLTQPPRGGTTRARLPMNFRQTGPGRPRIQPMSTGLSGPRDLRSFVSRPPGPVSRDPRFRDMSRIPPRSESPMGMMSRSRLQQQQQQQQQPRLRPVNRVTCRRPTVATCRGLPRGQRSRTRTSLCYMPCPGRRACIVTCECACLPETRRMDPGLRPSPRLLAGGGASGSISVRNTLQLQRPQVGRSFSRPTNTSRPTDLTFGISESALAAILSNPDVSSLVGPQGINDILAGETPPIISGGADAGVAPAGTIDPAPRRPQVPRGRSLAGQQQQPSPTIGIGIPIPMPPVTRPEPQMGNDMLLAGLLASSGDFGEMAREMTGLQMRTNIPSARGIHGAQMPAIDLMMPSATIDSTMRALTPSRATNGTSVDAGIGPRIIQPTATGLGQNLPITSNNTTFLANPPPNPGQPHDFHDFNHFLANIVQAPNQTFPVPDMRQFLEGALKSTDRQLNDPSKDDCLARRLELWCDPVGVWVGTPGVARWCILNCRSENCDRKRCACNCIDEMLFKQKFEQVRLQSP